MSDRRPSDRVPAIRRLVVNVLRGYTIGAADVVPGVSGGTIALVLRVYEALIGAVRDGVAAAIALVRFDPHETSERLRAIPWGLVIPITVGIGLAIVTLAAVLSHLLDTRPVIMSATFFGLILGSIVVVGADIERRDPRTLVVAAVVAIATFLLLGLRGEPLTDPGLPVVLAAGAIAICGMVLPGVSGAFILLMLGMYEAALLAITERDLAFVAVFGLGAAIGLATFASALKWLLEHHRDTTLAALVGLMAGSLRVLWPWPGDVFAETTLGAPVVADLPAAIAATAVGVVLVYLLARVGRPTDDEMP